MTTRISCVRDHLRVELRHYTIVGYYRVHVTKERDGRWTSCLSYPEDRHRVASLAWRRFFRLTRALLFGQLRVYNGSYYFKSHPGYSLTHGD